MLLEFTTTLPKLMLVGLTVSKDADATPFPVSDTVAGELLASLTTETLPLALPELAGLNTTPKDAVCPAVRVSGRERPLILKPVPVALA